MSANNQRFLKWLEAELHDLEETDPEVGEAARNYEQNMHGIGAGLAHHEIRAIYGDQTRQ